MTIRLYIHSSKKRAEATALVDSGATENFMNLDYAKWLGLPIKRLQYPRQVYNVDGTLNQGGALEFFTDLQVQTGTNRTNMRFFLANLGDHKLILGYPWFAAVQPKINWLKGWLDYSQLPIVLRSPDAMRAKSLPRDIPPTQREQESILVARVEWTEPPTAATKDSPIPIQYQRHQKVFSEQAAQRFPEPRIWDHAIELKPGAPSMIPGKIYALTQFEQEELKKFVQEHLKKGYIRPSKSPYAAPFFFIKKKDGKLRPVQDYRRINQWTIRNQYPLPLIPQLINKVRARTLFTKFDIRWGYNNVRIKAGDEWKAAFITKQGLFKPTVMFFGLTNSPATFQMMMDTIFAKEM
jgi:Reverse transcriptase (RNA-dependent DNA polymerase)